jgi:uncharacterized phage infection (PIP) family protein YhgE
MRKRSDTPTRSEITDTIGEQEDQMDEGKEQLNLTAEDADTVSDTTSALDFDGTSEGSDQLRDSMEQAQDVTAEVFERESEELDEVITEADEYQQDLQERSDSSQADLDKVSDASGRVQTQETREKLGQAEEGLTEDMEFLDGQIERARTAAEDTKQGQEQLKGRVQGRRR